VFLRRPETRKDAQVRLMFRGMSPPTPNPPSNPIFREVKDLTAQVHIYEDLLRELNPHLDSSSAQRVDETLSGKLVRVRGYRPYPSPTPVITFLTYSYHLVRPQDLARGGETTPWSPYPMSRRTSTAI
jgi:hypothetical protein